MSQISNENEMKTWHKYFAEEHAEDYLDGPPGGDGVVLYYFEVITKNGTFWLEINPELEDVKLYDENCDKCIMVFTFDEVDYERMNECPEFYKDIDEIIQILVIDQAFYCLDEKHPGIISIKKSEPPEKYWEKWDPCGKIYPTKDEECEECEEDEEWI